MRAPQGDEDDARLISLLKGETSRYEGFTGRTLLATGFEARFHLWGHHLELPVMPIREITAVAYTDSEDADQALDSSAWREAVLFSSWRLDWTDASTLPELADREDAVRVAFLAGCVAPGETESGLGAEFDQDEFDKIAVLRMVEQLYNGDAPMPEAELRAFAGHRRVFR